MTTFKIEKDTRWDSVALKSKVMYFVWADSKCLGCTSNEDEALKIYDSAKQHYIEPTTEIIKEETV